MTEKNPQELAKKHLARVEAAINLEEPDRVPLSWVGGDIIPAYAGITQHEFCYDYEKAIKAIEKYLKDFTFDWASAGIPGLAGRLFSVAFVEFPDIARFITSITGPMHDVLGDKYYRFPGREIDENCSPQFIGGTFMQPNEYDQLIEDPVGFIAETVLPRVCTNLETPRKTMATWVRYGIETNRFFSALAEIGKVSANLGYPTISTAQSYAPLDIIADFLRGFDTVLLDIYRYPDKVKKAAEALVDPVISHTLSFKKSGAKLAFIPLHLNEYLSPKLYNEFYWPTLKTVILELLKEDIKSYVFFEGYHDAHLETILELPRGWGIAYFEKTDVIKAKEVLKNHTCVMGGLPISLLVSATPQEIDKYVKNLLEKVKPDGGFILSPNIGTAPRETPVENISALINAVEKYG
ncbi:hypothetical protein TSYNTROOL_16180 [Tepidanaerobacter syntrophicus]|uniref:uroporphyrinogen decarboxylase family protein n=1 Tax=Tepidanaerobacter syntrophicus TaxID=224999 RepID=UPI001764383F|nr:uroporphyrinogen decarboxylase family protein [Tepidanaerobacter syntrophicus]GLI19903.1 hypothetical protein TSYNTROPHJE_17160 [Tepidanaerobacter syntrophicus]GLI51532.1 hypothetical protein TSYNTROOL_16180 [Tepidanaerobacter syntrophicus]HHY80615.1 hypothetical protein [Thermoanaerobacter sp.]